MPYADQHCGICGEFVKGNNLTRHVKRWHGDDDSTGSESGRQLSASPRVSCRSRSPQVSRKSSDKPTCTPPVSEEYVRNAVLCMLRRVENVNLPSLSKYLVNHFPNIPQAWHMPIVISAFTAAQKVAATHGDTVICDDEARSTLARKSLVRWTHGLSAIEPTYTARTTSVNQSSRDSSSSTEDRNAYSPATNFLLDREFPVPLDSRFDHVQIQREVNERMEVEVSQPNVQPRDDVNQSFNGPPIELNRINDVLVSVALASVTSPAINTSMPVIVPTEVEHVEANVGPSMENIPPALTPEDHQKDLCDLVPEITSFPSPVTFADLLSVHDVDDESLTRPLSVCLTPLRTPYRTQPDSDECGGSVVQLHPSPCPSLEEISEQSVVEERVAMKVPLSTEISERMPLMRVKVTKASEIVKSPSQSKEVEPSDQSHNEGESKKPRNSDQKSGAVQRNDDVVQIREATNQDVVRERKESTKSQRREEESRNSKENLKRPRDEDSRRHQRVDKSPKQVKNPVNSSGFKIPLKPRQENRSRDNCPVLSSGSARKLDYGDRHDSNRRPPTDIIRRWNPSIRVNDRGLTREQQRWLERMPRHW